MFIGIKSSARIGALAKGGEIIYRYAIDDSEIGDLIFDVSIKRSFWDVFILEYRNRNYNAGKNCALYIVYGIKNLKNHWLGNVNDFIFRVKEQQNSYLTSDEIIERNKILNSLLLLDG